MQFKKLIITGALIVSSLGFSACSSTDVVGNTAKKSFEALISKNQNITKADASSGRWLLESPSGDRFEWSKDFSKDTNDIVITLDAKPFIDAGLDTSKLPAGKFNFDRTNNKIVMPFEISSEKYEYSKDPSPTESFNQIIDKNRKLIGYHEKLDHYGITLLDGNKFEWAKDTATNDKDIVFVLNPKPFIDAGVNPEKVNGVVFTQVEESMDNPEKKIDVFLKPFNLQ